MNSLSEADIVDVLSKINDLSRGKDIYSLGIVTNIHIKDNNVQITLEVEVIEPMHLRSLEIK